MPQIAWWAVTRRTVQTTEQAKWGGGVGTYVGMGACPRQYGTYSAISIAEYNLWSI